MKKLIAMIMALMMSICLSFGQGKSNYVGLTKKDTLTISVLSNDINNFKALTDIQTDLSKSVKNQNKITLSLANVLVSLNKGINAYVKEIEKRNKTDSNNLITTYFNYSTEQVKEILKRQRIIYIGMISILLVYLIIVFNARLPANKKTIGEWVLYFIKNIIVIVLWYILLTNILTIFLNPQYPIIMSIINLYT